MDHKTYDSSVQNQALKLTAPYYNAIVPTKVHFVREHSAVYVDSLGHIEFFDEKDTSLGAVDLPVHKDPSEYGHTAQYGNAECSADGRTITVHLPVYGWTDNYPHCDGESDRWDRYISRWFRVVFDCTAHEIKILDRER